MRLADLHPSFYGAGGEGIFDQGPDGKLVPAPKREGMGLMCDCPGCHSEDHILVVPFANPIDGGTGSGWQRTGDTVETLTLSPSVLRLDGCHWHGWIRNGEVTSC